MTASNILNLLTPRSPPAVAEPSQPTGWGDVPSGWMNVGDPWPFIHQVTSQIVEKHRCKHFVKGRVTLKKLKIEYCWLNMCSVCQLNSYRIKWGEKWKTSLHEEKPSASSASSSLNDNNKKLSSSLPLRELRCCSHTCHYVCMAVGFVHNVVYFRVLNVQ